MYLNFQQHHFVYHLQSALYRYLFLASIALIFVFVSHKSTAQTVGEPVQLSRNLFLEDVDLGEEADLNGVYQIGPGGTRAVYLSDQNTDGVSELFSVPIAGGEPVRLNAELLLNGNVIDFKISSNGARVIYLADQNTDEVFELFSVAIIGGTPVRLNGNLTAGGDVVDFEISPDGTRVVYRADQNSDENRELFSVAISGGTPVQLTAELPEGGTVFNGFQISPDGMRVVYRANITIDQNRDSKNELFSVDITGGTTVRLNSTLDRAADVRRDFQISSDGTQVVYLADQNMLSVYELFSVAITGGLPVRLNADLPRGGDISVGGFIISPDDTRVVYRADQNMNDVFELFSVATIGGLPVRLNANLPQSGDVDDSGGFIVSPDGTRVVYRADQNTNDVFELFSVAIIGGLPVRLNADLPEGGDVSFDGFRISADGTQVVYQADQNISGVNELFSVATTGGAPVRLNADLPEGGDTAEGFQISPKDRFIVYVADQVTDGEFELFSVDLGTAPNDELCVPIKSSNDKVALICL